MENCIFCKIANGEIPAATIFENEDVRVILDIAPANKGHAILLPKTHVKNIFELPEKLAGKIFTVVPGIARAIQETIGCDGMNILQNNEEAAGQTVFHLHIHFIPRWKKDNVQFDWKKGAYAEREANRLAAEICKNMQA